MAQSPETRKAELVAAASDLLAADRDGRDLTRLVAALTDRGSAEDLGRYAPSELAEAVREAHADLARRTPGTPKVRVFNPRASAGDRLAAVSVVQMVNDDMPFLVDSAMGELTESGHEIDLVLHPILAVGRDADGALGAFHGLAAKTDGHAHESLIHIHVRRIETEEERQHLVDRLTEVLAQVRLATRDWRAMLGRLDAVIAATKANPPPLAVEDLAEALQFLEWLREDNFTFLGVRDYAFDADGEGKVDRIEESGLGVLADPNVRILRRGSELVTNTPEVVQFLKGPAPIIVTKANVRSRVHRRVHMDYVGVKLFDAAGRVVGERRILGLFTSTAYTRSTKTIPFVRRKVERVIARAGFDPASHSGKALLNVLEGYPRDELFQIDEERLLDFALQILALDEHPRVRVLARPDRFDRFVSVLVYVPRDRYSTDVRVRLGQYLASTYQGHVSVFFPSFPEGSLARVHFIVGRHRGKTPEIDQEDLETAASAIIKTFADGLKEALAEAYDPTRASLSLARYREAFSLAYQESYGATTAVADVKVIERLSAERRIAVDFYRREGQGGADLALKLYHAERPIPLSDRVPVLENLGLRVIDETTHEIRPSGMTAVFLHDLTLTRADGAAFELTREIDERLEALFVSVWLGRAENDGFNQLALAAGLGWRDISIFRALARYLRQIGIPYSLDYVWSALVRHAEIVVALAELFRLRFDPDRKEGDRSLAEAQAVKAIEGALDAVASLDDDRILRRLLNLATAILRTNVYQIEPDGRARETFAFKIDPRRVVDMPEPKPYREIWVYGPRVEGVHLRFGPVARGGLRWSDRAQDFRTEVLGLVKAQQVKNAVIVPMGAKGGFFPRRLPPPAQREAFAAEGAAAYETFVSTLLTVTDDIGPTGIVAPERVVRHDGDDPYLVVAADKGTATFSDRANAISGRHGFWLGDAFASGGSAGYDHKKMGITARGGWEAVKRHFREMDVDIQTTPFTVAGVGDMSGDVFGNGMLLSPAIRLVAAFDHRDIFLDPDPDPVKGLAERARMFALPRSSWADYDRAAISRGGGVFSRGEKAITLSAEAQALLGLAQAKATPQEVMHAILKMPVDLLWFGGIGTYVRASDETDAEAGDRANDALRVTASELGARVVGEGANLGMTQRARIEYHLKGGRSNSDAIDNSAGVNSSDMEVNIKIAFGQAMRAGRLDLAERNRILAAMTDEVAGLVLSNNYRQTLAVSLARRRGLEDFGPQRRLMQRLEKAGDLNRKVEFLPSDAVLARREADGTGLTRAEIGVLLAYAKLDAKARLLASDLLDEPHLDAELVHYFPSAMRERFAEAIAGHRLRREIVATALSNAMVDHGGPTLTTRLLDQTGADTPAVARAFVVARDVFGLADLVAEIDRLDTRVAGALQLDLYGAAQDLLHDAVVWFVRNGTQAEAIGATVERFAGARRELSSRIASLVPPALAAPAEARAEAWRAAGVPDALAGRLARLPFEAAIPDLALVAGQTKKPLATVAAAHFAVADRFGIGRLDALGRAIRVADTYDGLALDRARRLLADAHRGLVAASLAHRKGLDGWLAERGGEVERALATIAEILGAERLTVGRFAVATGLLSDLARP